MANKLDPKRLESTIEHLEAWCIEQGLFDEVVDPEEVAQIVAQYEGDAEPTPLELFETFFERRKVSVS